MANEKRKQARESSAQAEPPCDALQRMLSVKFQDYKPITWQRAEELADFIIETEDDAKAYALIELLHGICAADRIGVEEIVIAATRRAYSRTTHFSAAFDEFAALDPNNPRDACVINRQFEDETVN